MPHPKFTKRPGIGRGQHPNSKKALLKTAIKPGEVRNPEGKGRKGVTFELHQAIERLTGIKPTKADMRQIMTGILAMDRDEMTQVAKNEEIPMLLVNLAMAMLTDTKGGKTDTVRYLIDQIIGKAKQEHDVQNRTFVVPEAPRKTNKGGAMVKAVEDSDDDGE